MKKALSLSLSLSLSDSVTLKPHKLLLVLSLALFLASASFLFVAEAQAQGFPIYSWGNNSVGQLGQGDYGADTNRDVPTRMPGPANWVFVGTAAGGSYAISAQGYLYAWGNAGNAAQMGQGGAGSSAILATPTRVGTADNWTMVTARSTSVAAINSDGHLYTWGTNIGGLLGHGDTLTRNAPLRVPGYWKTVDVSGVGAHTLAIRTDGSLWAWGSNTNGRLGLGVAGGENRLTPQRVGNLYNWESVEAGSDFSIAVNTAGYVYTWGTFTLGRLGRPTTAPHPPNHTPGRVMGLPPVAIVSTTHDAHTTVALTRCGELWSWGSNSTGAAGLGVGGTISTPQQIGTENNWRTIMGGNSHFLAINADHRLYAWGNNDLGQLGIGEFGGTRNVPTYVATVERFSGAANGGGRQSLMLIDLDLIEANFNLTKHLQKPEGTPAPNLNFRFTFERNSFNDNTTPADINRIPVINPIILNPTTVVSPPPPPAGTITLEAYFDFLDGIVFTEVGTFSWIIREDATHPAGQGLDSEVVFSQAEYELRVYVGQEAGIGGDLYIRFITLHRLTDPITGYDLVPPQKVNNLIFVNTYTYDPFITPTGLWITGGSLYLVIFATGVALTAYLSQRARKRIEELPIMH